MSHPSSKVGFVVVFSNQRLGPSAELLVSDEVALEMLRATAANASPVAAARWLCLRDVNLHGDVPYHGLRARFNGFQAQAFSSSLSTFSSVHFRATASSFTISCFALSSILRSPNDSTLLLFNR